MIHYLQIININIKIIVEFSLHFNFVFTYEKIICLFLLTFKFRYTEIRKRKRRSNFSLHSQLQSLSLRWNNVMVSHTIYTLLDHCIYKCYLEASIPALIPLAQCIAGKKSKNKNPYSLSILCFKFINYY